MASQKKKDIVKNLSELLSKSKAIYLADYKGLTHKELEDLRRKIKQFDAHYSIVKNTLWQIALKQSQFSILNSKFSISGPTAILFAYSDPIKPLKTFTQDYKDRLKAAFAFGQYLTGESLDKLVNLEPEETLIYGFARALNWNLQRLTLAINEIKKAKGGDNNA